MRSWKQGLFFILISWDENPRVRAEAKRRPAKQIPHSPLKMRSWKQGLFFILISWDENPRVRAEAKRRPAKQIPHSPLKKDLVIKAFFILNLVLVL
jgi:hypothetical protein